MTLHDPHISRRVHWDGLMDALAELAMTFPGSTVQRTYRLIAADAWRSWRRACDEIAEMERRHAA